ncbi:MAG: shikimate kinase [bacterium]|nr:shikimate kinase [bacterium]
MKNIILIGMKNSGKSTLAKKISEHFKMNLIKLDNELEKNHFQKTQEHLTFREIHKKYGAEYFQSLDHEVLNSIISNNIENCVIDCGGSTPLQENNQKLLKQLGNIIFINLENKINLERILKNGIPPFFKYQNDPQKSFDELIKIRLPIYKKIADFEIKCSNESTDKLLRLIIKLPILNI